MLLLCTYVVHGNYTIHCVRKSMKLHLHSVLLFVNYHCLMRLH
uniref:Uncharacterized protein n=1 Tax=Anguilla anguilla TaxID=7936 RepID=A0A0E9SAR1_ANGAN